MRVPVWLLVVGTVTGVYLLARQAAPETVKGLEDTVTNYVDAFIAGLEGFSATPYKDEAGLWTIGMGHLIVAGDGYWSPTNPFGKKSVTLEEARAQQDADTLDARSAINRGVKVQLNASQDAALLSLVFNIGSGNFSTSTLLRRLNAGDYQGAADQFLVWNKVRDENTGQLVESPGLVTRREKERALFLA